MTADAVAAGIGHPLRFGDQLALASDEFGQAVNPVIGHPMRRAGIENPHRRVGKPRCRFLGRVVRQTQEYDGRVLKRLFPRRWIFAQLFRKRDDFEVISPREPLANAQRGGAGLAVDINFRWHWI